MFTNTAYLINSTNLVVNSTIIPRPVTATVNIHSVNISFAFDFFFVYIVPCICALGIVTNVLNIIVFSQKELKDETYNYLKMNAYSNLFYLMICFFVFVNRCGQLCQFDTTLASNIYYWAFYIYVKGIFAIFTVCIQILVSMLRLSIMLNKKLCKLPNYKVTSVILVIFSAIFYSPYGFTKEITEKNILVFGSNNTYVTTYSVVNSSIGESNLGKTLIIVTTIIRGYVCAIIIIIINVISKTKLDWHIQKSTKMQGGQKIMAKKTPMILEQTQDQTQCNTSTTAIGTSTMSMSQKEKDKSVVKKKIQFKPVYNKKEKASRNLTFMVIITACLYIVGNAPNSFGFILLQYYNSNSEFVKIVNIVANATLFTSQGCDLFVYYFTNKNYRAILRKIFHLK